jgi:hypothetical protein
MKRVICDFKVYENGKYKNVILFVSFGGKQDRMLNAAIYSNEVWSMCHRNGYGPDAFFKK